MLGPPRGNGARPAEGKTGPRQGVERPRGHQEGVAGAVGRAQITRAGVGRVGFILWPMGSYLGVLGRGVT